MAKVTYVLAQGENSAGESQVNFRVYVSRELRVRVPSAFGSIGNVGERKTISIFRTHRGRSAMRCWQSG